MVRGKGSWKKKEEEEEEENDSGTPTLSEGIREKLGLA
jgi:hypothetical protein